MNVDVESQIAAYARWIEDRAGEPMSRSATRLSPSTVDAPVEDSIGWVIDTESRNSGQPRRLRWLALAACVVVVIGGLLILGGRSSTEPPIPANQPSNPRPIPEPTQPAPSGGMWPQSTQEGVREAQALADSGDPAYTWQVDPELSSEDGQPYFGNPDTEIVQRFIREVLGWDDFMFSPFDSSWSDESPGQITGLLYLRCGTGGSSTLYPTAPCTPTIDELRYETVSVDIAQLDRHGQTGLWVVSGWSITTPAAQINWRVAEAEATGRLEQFLTARVAGTGAEGYVTTADFGPEQAESVPLLYATSKGGKYERYEIERTGGPAWPSGHMDFEVRLLTDGGATVVAQRVAWDGGDLRLSARSTTENGQPVPVTYRFFDGEVTASAATPWTYLFEEDGLALGDQFGDQHLDLAPRPRSVTADCVLGPAPTDAEALAESIRSHPDLEVTEPLDVTVSGVSGLQIDVMVAPGAHDCGSADVEVVRKTVGLDQRKAFLLAPGYRMRLYLLDVPDGSAVWPMAIAVVAPEALFEDVIEAARPVLSSIEFNTG